MSKNVMHVGREINACVNKARAYKARVYCALVTTLLAVPSLLAEDDVVEVDPNVTGSIPETVHSWWHVLVSWWDSLVGLFT